MEGLPISSIANIANDAALAQRPFSRSKIASDNNERALLIAVSMPEAAIAGVKRSAYCWITRFLGTVNLTFGSFLNHFPFGSIPVLYQTVEETIASYDALAWVVSIALQSGAPLAKVSGMLLGAEFEPAGPVLGKSLWREARFTKTFFIRAISQAVARLPKVSKFRGRVSCVSHRLANPLSEPPQKFFVSARENLAGGLVCTRSHTNYKHKWIFPKALT